MQLCHCQPGGSRTFLPSLVEFGVCPPVLVSPGVSVSVNVVVVICFRKKFGLANWLTHQEYGHPGHADVVEGYGALKGILPLLFARGIILIPIDARCVCRFVQVEQLGILWEWEEWEERERVTVTVKVSQSVSRSEIGAFQLDSTQGKLRKQLKVPSKFD